MEQKARTNANVLQWRNWLAHGILEIREDSLLLVTKKRRFKRFKKDSVTRVLERYAFTCAEKAGDKIY
ncbi:unnamed protein product [Allacma fusca]|uniref:Uncharacterized protein n=1 Tax=Allacma fusca TaxID=39272 RepID=A0A8J2PNG6_9HEXA|nr:unnamed protein product [Allacma fusca]